MTRVPPQDCAVVVFDFDGTLIDSNRLKYDAFFKVADESGIDASLIERVLSVHLEASRYDILRRVVEAAKFEPVEDETQRLAALYGDIVLDGAKNCSEIPGASALLECLAARFPLYLSSTTPEVALKQIVEYRDWARHFKGIHGYPRKKADTLRQICQSEGAAPAAVLVVGDGESDRTAAAECGCGFFPVVAKDALNEVPAFAGL